MKTLRCLLCLMILASILSACTKQSQGGTAVVDSPCSIPCWQNITPGVTKAEDLEKLLQVVPDIDKNGIVKLPAWDIFDGVYRFAFKDQRVEGVAYIKNDLVNQIHIDGELNVPIDQIIQLYEKPEKLIVSTIVNPGRFGGSGIILEINLVYISKGVAFSFLNRDLNLITIKADALIKKVIYAEPETIVRIVSPDERPLEQLEQQGRAFDWNGYQEIKFNPKK